MSAILRVNVTLRRYHLVFYSPFRIECTQNEKAVAIVASVYRLRHTLWIHFAYTLHVFHRWTISI